MIAYNNGEGRGGEDNGDNITVGKKFLFKRFKTSYKMFTTIVFW